MISDNMNHPVEGNRRSRMIQPLTWLSFLVNGGADGAAYIKFCAWLPAPFIKKVAFFRKKNNKNGKNVAKSNKKWYFYCIS